jgi:hypothetical protein
MKKGAKRKKGRKSKEEEEKVENEKGKTERKGRRCNVKKVRSTTHTHTHTHTTLHHITPHQSLQETKQNKYTHIHTIHTNT